MRFTSIFFNKIAKISKNWSNVLYLLILLLLGLQLLGFTQAFFPVLFYAIFFVVISFSIKILNPHIFVRYIMGLISFITYILIFIYYDISYENFIKVAYNMLLLYSYIFLDFITPNIIATLLAFRFAYYYHQEDIPFSIARSSIIGLYVQSVCYSVVFFLIRKLIRERNRFEKLSITDSLTNVYNLAYIIKKGQKLLDKGQNLAIVVIDMNNFKQINDTYGHVAGNKVLKQIGKLLTKKARNVHGILGRLGGDEFVIIIKEKKEINIDKFVKDLYTYINNEHFTLDPDIDPVKLSFSIGLANSKQMSGTVNIENLLYNADIDMYYNKYGKNMMQRNLKTAHHFFPYQIKQFLNVLAEKDMYTYVHSEFTAKYAAALARKLQMPHHLVSEIYVAGWLHDIGKILISNNILRKTSKLADDEYHIIKRHLHYGLNVLGNQDLTDLIKNAVKYHHEQWNGKGYPFNLEKSDIPLEARILKIADSFSAMTIKRVYRKPLTKKEALIEIKKYSGVHFDPELVPVFESIFHNEEKKFISETINNWLMGGLNLFNTPELIGEQI